MTCSSARLSLPPKLAKAKMDEYAEQAALVSALVDDVQALVPIHDDVLHKALVQAFIENDPQVH